MTEKKDKKPRKPLKPLGPLARYRMARGIQQKQLAELLRVRPATVCAWECGNARPEPHRIPTLALALGIEPLKCAELLDAAPLPRPLAS